MAAFLLISACSSSDGGADDQAGESSTTAPNSGSPDTGPGSGDSSDEADGEGGSATTAPGVEDPSIDDEALAERLAELGGTLAVGNAQELSLVSPDGSGALLLDGSESVLASQPTWSGDGTRLAWSSISAERQVVLVQDYDADGAPDGEPQISNAEGNPVFYLQWNGSDDRLAYIRNASVGGRVEVGTAAPGAPIEPVAQGAPFFISWAPETDRLAGHVNERSVDLYRAADDGAEEPDGFQPVLPVSGGFSAPTWTSDDRLVVVVDGALANLDPATGETDPIIEVPGTIRFVLSPDRTKLAYQVFGGGGDGPALIATGLQQQQTGESSLIVLDLETAEQTLVTNELAVAWEWSPDSRKLAWLQAEIRGGRPSGSWSFWSSDGPLPTSETPTFILTGKYGRNYLPFFAQYAQSVTGWSPDSSAYGFAGSLRGDGGVWIQLVDERVDPQLVSRGDFVTWGPADIPLPSSGPSAA